MELIETRREDYSFGRSVIEHDPKSRMFMARGAVFEEGVPLRSKTWRRPSAYDQGQNPHCVAFATKGTCWSQPIAQTIDLDVRKAIDTTQLYRLAQTMDPWPGEAYDGTSTLAGLKAAHSDGYIPGYRWCFGIDDVLQTLSQYGPVMIGVNWMTGMMETDDEGLIRATGQAEGGHCVELHGIDVRDDEVIGTNSWGISWGAKGRFRLKFRDLDFLLQEQGEAATVAPTVQTSD